MKFGSSVLRSVDDLPGAVHEIYGEWRRGNRIIAVVSALGSTTDELLAQAKGFEEEPNPRNLAKLLATGESTCAALLALALERAGVPSRLVGPAEIGLISEGGHLDAHPVELDVAALGRELDRAPVLILPGFIGHRRDGDLTLFGRGGSDLTAIFVAGRLRRDFDQVRCVLVKDVDGLFEWDPAGSAASPPRCFERISYGDALELSGDVVQHKAIRLARESGMGFEVGSVASLAASQGGHRKIALSPTRVGSETSIMSQQPAQRFTRLRVGIAGHGTVGAGVLQHLLAASEEFEVTGVLVRDLEKHRLSWDASPKAAEDTFDRLFTDDGDEFFARPIDVFVELTGGLSPAKAWIECALDRGLDVVSANKALLAKHGNELQFVARNRHANLLYSAAVGGAAPLLETAARLSGEPVRGFEAILNATSNHVLESMSRGASLEQSVRAAQDSGFAEADPSLDLDGTDACQKTELLAREVFGADVILRWGTTAAIQDVTGELLEEARAAQGSVRLVASCHLEEDPENLAPKRAFACLHPVLLPSGHPLCHLTGAGAAIAFDLQGRDSNRVVVTGSGAGRWPTAQAVVSDLFELRHAPLRQVAVPLPANR
ncbi:MAG: homoserine dehydrogenase [bacterium]|nr:homoserine dehydrogenase [bacterium]